MSVICPIQSDVISDNNLSLNLKQSSIILACNSLHLQPQHMLLHKSYHQNTNSLTDSLPQIWLFIWVYTAHALHLAFSEILVNST